MFLSGHCSAFTLKMLFPENYYMIMIMYAFHRPPHDRASQEQYIRFHARGRHSTFNKLSVVRAFAESQIVKK